MASSALRPFTFLNLPSELRQQIYTEVLQPDSPISGVVSLADVPPNIRCRCARTTDCSFYQEVSYRHSGCVNVFLLCRQIYLESLYILKKIPHFLEYSALEGFTQTYDECVHFKDGSFQEVWHLQRPIDSATIRDVKTINLTITYSKKLSPKELLNIMDIFRHSQHLSNLTLHLRSLLATLDLAEMDTFVRIICPLITYRLGRTNVIVLSPCITFVNDHWVVAGKWFERAREKAEQNPTEPTEKILELVPFK